MIARSGGRDIEVKGLLEDAWPYPVIPPEFGVGINAAGGNPFWPFMSMEQAMGLPALLGVLLRVSTACGMLPQKVYEGDDQLNRQVATESWQYDLIHDHPGVSGEHTPFTLRADIALAVAGGGYCCVRKYKVPDSSVDGGIRVAELLPQNSQLIIPKRKNGRLIFEDRTEGTMVERDSSEIIYIRAPATNGGVAGLAPITLTRMGISTALKRQVFEGSYYDKSAEPRVVLAFPEQMSSDQAQEWKDVWNDQHQGLANAHGTSVIGGGATVNTIPVSLADAQFVESTRQTADQLGFIYGMPKVFMNTVERPNITDNDWRYFVTFGLSWIMTAIDQAFSSDRDLFPRAGNKMHVETLVDAFLKPDIATRYGAYLVARQAGWLTSNEVRALENYPPIKGGDVLQITPVGAGVDNTGTPPPDGKESLEQLLADFKDGSEEQKAIVARMTDRARDAGLL